MSYYDSILETKEKLNEVQGLGAKITDEEALAIARQKQVVEELTATEDKSEIQKLELAVAEINLTKLKRKLLVYLKRKKTQYEMLKEQKLI